MQVVSVDPHHPREERVEAAVRELDAGGLLAIPTETFYGLATDAFDGDALRRVNAAKGKPPDAAIMLLLSDPSQVEQVSGSLPPVFYELAGLFWPGPLTLVVPASSRLDDELFGKRGTVAVRVPGLPIPRRLAASLGRPISGVSANRHGEPPCRTAPEVVQIFGDELTMVLDGGATTGGAPSTILDLTTPRPVLLREGLLPASALRAYLPELVTPSL